MRSGVYEVDVHFCCQNNSEFVVCVYLSAPFICGDTASAVVGIYPEGIQFCYSCEVSSEFRCVAFDTDGCVIGRK